MGRRHFPGGDMVSQHPVNKCKCYSAPRHKTSKMTNFIQTGILSLPFVLKLPNFMEVVITRMASFLSGSVSMETALTFDPNRFTEITFF